MRPSHGALWEGGAGMVDPTGGDALLAGHSVVRQPGAAQHARVGLCPQVHLSGRLSLSAQQLADN